MKRYRSIKLSTDGEELETSMGSEEAVLSQEYPESGELDEAEQIVLNEDELSEE